MKIRCPACGATASLDALIAHDDAREALKLLVQLGGEVASVTMRYLGLFRPAKTELTFARLAKLLAEIVPDMQAQRIERNGQLHDAPPAAWVWAMQQTLAARDSGKLTVPLKSHGYLYEIITNYRAEPGVVAAPTQPGQAMQTVGQPMAQAPSKVVGAIAALEGLKR